MRLAGIRQPRAATLVERTGAYLLDAVATFLLWAVICLTLARGSIDALTDDGLLRLTAGLLFVLVPWAYLVAFEGWLGTTPGKRLWGLRVVGPRHQPPGLYRATVRNVFRLAWALGPVGPIFLLIDVVLIQATEADERVGDMVSGTRVIRMGPARFELR